MAKRGRQANLSFFAFTATPKHKTLAVFGRDGQPAHRYTMRQAIEEEFILDVLKHYTTLRDLLQAAQGLRGRSERRAQEGRAGAGALHEAAPAQHRAEDRGHGRALPGRHPAQDRRSRQGDGRDRLAPRSRSLQAELRSVHQGEGLRHQVAGGVLRHGAGRQARGRDLHRGGHEPRHHARRSCRRSSRPRSTRFCSWRRSTRPGSINRCCTRCSWTSGSPASRPCRRCRA